MRERDSCSLDARSRWRWFNAGCEKEKLRGRVVEWGGGSVTRVERKEEKSTAERANIFKTFLIISVAALSHGRLLLFLLCDLRLLFVPRLYIIYTSGVALPRWSALEKNVNKGRKRAFDSRAVRLAKKKERGDEKLLFVAPNAKNNGRSGVGVRAKKLAAVEPPRAHKRCVLFPSLYVMFSFLSTYFGAGCARPAERPFRLWLSFSPTRASSTFQFVAELFSFHGKRDFGGNFSPFQIKQRCSQSF